MKVYFDNAATTPLDPSVWEAMEPFLKEHFGNPSSTHAFGRTAKNAMESARRSIAQALHVQPGQIIFTGSGTEGNNTILSSAVQQGVNHIISSAIEHHAVLNTLLSLEHRQNIKVSFVALDEHGNVSLDSLKTLLENHPEDKKLVTLMHVNNEIGTVLPIHQVGAICKSHDALFHSDTVQSMGTISLDFNEAMLDYATCSAHKFHGPKGVGFMYVKDSSTLNTFIHGGSQERGHRAGTENVAGVIGLAAALNLSLQHLETQEEHLKKLRNYFIMEVKQLIPSAQIVGNEVEKASPKILNVCFPSDVADDMFLFNLDLRGIAASGGSACSSGSNQGSHVIGQIRSLQNCRAVRFSFSKYNSIEEIDYVIEQIAEIIS